MDALSAIAIGRVDGPANEARADAAIAQKAREFEAVMLAQFLKPMFDSVDGPGLLGGDGNDQKIFGAMLQETYAEAMAARGGIGIADQVKAALIQMQAEQSSQKGMSS